MAKTYTYQTEQEVLDAARSITARRCRAGEQVQPAYMKQFLQLKMHEYEHEVFSVVFLDHQNRIIETAEMFHGTLAQVSVYPREIVKRALKLNAGAVILVHNHPSGACEPSRADEFMTATVKSALAMVDVRVLDHYVVASGGVCSFAERGLL